MTGKKYTEREVQDKIDSFLGDKKFKVSNKFNTVENLMENVEKAIKSACDKHGAKYPPTFRQVLDYTEKALLSSKNWFNSDGLNFTSIRNCLNLRIENKDNYIPELDFFYNISGSKEEKSIQIKELISVGQNKRFKSYDLNKLPVSWQFNPSLRFRNITYLDESDAYQQEKIDLKCRASKPIIKGFNNGYFQDTLLIAIHHHSYTEDYDSQTKETGYYPIMERFEIVLII